MQLAKLKSLRPPLLRAGDFSVRCYARKQMWPEAIAAIQRPNNKGPRAQARLGYLFARAGRTDEARSILRALLDRARRTNDGTFQVATVYAGLGENDQAFAWLDKSIEDRSFEFDDLMMLDRLRRDPRFDSFRRHLGGQKR
jgi:tetratricopeptide (TPR) repeat protein